MDASNPSSGITGQAQRIESETTALPGGPLVNELSPFPWRQDLTNFPRRQDLVHGARPSRASSIVSTRTGVTIGTLQDEVKSLRSVDIVLGERLFHINRDASRISILDQGDLPPYSSLAEGLSPNRPMLSTSPLGYDSSKRRSSNADVPAFRLQPPVSHTPGLLQPPSSLSGPSEDQSVARSWSFRPGPDEITVIPKRRSASQGNITDHLPGASSNVNPRVRRRNGIRLPKIFTGIRSSGEPNSAGTVSAQQETTTPNANIIHSAGPSLGGEGYYPRSPSYIGREAAGIFPSSLDSAAFKYGYHNRAISPPTTPTPQILEPQGPAEVEEGHVDTRPPAMDSENDISIHYTRLIRSIDRDNRKYLHTRDTELARMRERLNEMDQVYRKELKARDFVIDDLRKRLENQEEQTQTLAEQARNDVEDWWEANWKVRDGHLVERMRRMELDFQKQLEQAVADRDSEWVAELEARDPGLLVNVGIGGRGEVLVGRPEPDKDAG